MKRPTFFISSTIYDFRDLRSALKFYLEERGCKVLASEFNDFHKALDIHSYEACLQSIHTADYFILFIGNRVGGWYDEQERISITQREYREAYKLQVAGKLKIINFVRADIWQFRETRQELITHLESIALNENTKKSISNYTTKIAGDAEFLSDFIKEVSRSSETKLTVQGKGNAPSGNWIHVFHNFRDVVDVLHGQMFSTTPMEDMALMRLLRRELRKFISQSLVKFKADGEIYSPRFYIERFHKENPITMDMKTESFTPVSTKYWRQISTLSFNLIALQFQPIVLPQVISSPIFLDFDFATSSYKESRVYEALLRLQEEMYKFTASNTPTNLSVVFKHSSRTHPVDSGTIQIETLELVSLLHLLDRWSNILDLTASILRHLDGKKFQMPKLRPDSPIQGMQEMIEDEKPNDQDVDKYLSADN